MNIIANTGIQLLSKQIEINLNNRFKLFFHEWFDVKTARLNLELAHHFTNDDVWVKKNDLGQLGFLDKGKVGYEENGNFKSFQWNDVSDIFFQNNKSVIKPNIYDNQASDCFAIDVNKCNWEKFENKWLPFPYFKVSKGKSDFGPTNWCRIKIIPVESNKEKRIYNIILAFDTQTDFEEEGFETDELYQRPVFTSFFEKSIEFELCNNEFALIDFCSQSQKCKWVDDYILKQFHGVEKLSDLRPMMPKLSYIAQYIFLIKYLQEEKLIPKVTLFTSKCTPIKVDLVVDIGNSRTCAILFDDSNFTKVDMLELQNFTNPIKTGTDKLNKYKEPFDMRLVFRNVDFGQEIMIGSNQFIYPSFVRLGEEANELNHQSTNLLTDTEKITTFSSAKRYLWDKSPQKKEWEFISINSEKQRPVWLNGVSQYINNDGSLNTEGNGGIISNYSRSSLMTFCFLEILAQVQIQINSFEYRNKWGSFDSIRQVGRLIITCPTAMSRVEQKALRQSALNASEILNQFSKNYFTTPIQIVPPLSKSTEWIYDEATSSQFVYLYAEIRERYQNNYKEFFDLYGKYRDDIENYDKKSITIGSIDIGAGTTDLMIATYKYEDSSQCLLTPVPIFWESFYLAGDDLLKEMIRQIIIVGPFSFIRKHLEFMAVSNSDISKLISDFFGEDNARLSIHQRQIRSEFNLQVSIPLALYFLELSKENSIETIILDFSDIFSLNKPTKKVLDAFMSHFGFSIENIQFRYDRKIVSKIMHLTFDSLISTISTILAYYGCDIVLLSGRPTSLESITNMFLKYYAVPPNRLISLNNYRVGNWYPFQNGNGYFNDSKSIVAVGAMIGYHASNGSLNGFSLKFSELVSKLIPTTEYFTTSENDTNPFISKIENIGTLRVHLFPFKIWCRQLNSKSYPTRPIYVLNFNVQEIKSSIRNQFNLTDNQQIEIQTQQEIEKLRNRTPFEIKILRQDYLEDRETLIIESIIDKNGDDVRIQYFVLQIQSMSENENYWLDSGEFSNISIN